MPTPDLAERVWWERVDRAATRKGVVGAKILADWAHDVLELVATEENVAMGRYLELSQEPEMRGLNDGLGRSLGVGPMPGMG